MYFNPPSGGRFGRYLYVRIYIYTYVQIAFVQVTWDLRSRGQGHDYTPPPPCGRTQAGSVMGAMLLRREVGVQCHGREAAKGGGVLLHELIAGLCDPGEIGSDPPNLHVHVVLQHCHAQTRGDGQHLSARRLGVRMLFPRPGQKEPCAGGVRCPPHNHPVGR